MVNWYIGLGIFYSNTLNIIRYNYAKNNFVHLWQVSQLNWHKKGRNSAQAQALHDYLAARSRRPFISFLYKPDFPYNAQNSEFRSLLWLNLKPVPSVCSKFLSIDRPKPLARFELKLSLCISKIKGENEKRSQTQK